MGDPRKAKKKYYRPLKPYNKKRIEEEEQIMKKYGLKNKREIWRAELYIGKIRDQAKKLILNPEGQERLFNRLLNYGLIKENASIDDVLDLTKEAVLDRRLQTFILKKGFAKTTKEARQLIVHRKIRINDRIVTIPSYLVKVKEENKIKLIEKKIKETKKESIQEIAREIENTQGNKVSGAQKEELSSEEDTLEEK